MHVTTYSDVRTIASCDPVAYTTPLPSPCFCKHRFHRPPKERWHDQRDKGAETQLTRCDVLDGLRDAKHITIVRFRAPAPLPVASQSRDARIDRPLPRGSRSSLTSRTHRMPQEARGFASPGLDYPTEFTSLSNSGLKGPGSKVCYHGRGRVSGYPAPQKLKLGTAAWLLVGDGEIRAGQRYDDISTIIFDVQRIPDHSDMVPKEALAERGSRQTG